MLLYFFVATLVKAMFLCCISRCYMFLIPSLKPVYSDDFTSNYCRELCCHQSNSHCCGLKLEHSNAAAMSDRHAETAVQPTETTLHPAGSH